MAEELDWDDFTASLQELTEDQLLTANKLVIEVLNQKRQNKATTTKARLRPGMPVTLSNLQGIADGTEAIVEEIHKTRVSVKIEGRPRGCRVPISCCTIK